MLSVLFSLLCLHISVLHTIPPPPSCNQLKYSFSSRGVPLSQIPSTPLKEPGLELCPAGPSCCSRTAETKLGDWSLQQFREDLATKTDQMAGELEQRAQQIDDYVYSLLNKAQREFHDMFTRTYGVIYQKNAQVFQNYFRDLKIYYDKGNLSPADSTSSFFNALYQKMFQVLNAQYSFDGLYLSCVSDNIDSLRPFGDVPRKLASSVKRSLLAARALVKAMRTGHEIAKQMAKMSPSAECELAVKKMRTCSACQGLPDFKPCNGYCINIMKGCLAYHGEINDSWNEYIESLMSLSERLAGPFNVEMTIEPISIKISDAIMNFQESGFQVTQKVFSLCGTPRLGKRAALPATSQFVFEKRLDKSHRPPSRPVKSEFEKNLLDLKKRLKAAEGFWSLVPYQMCDGSVEKPQSHVRDKQSCWNGVEPGRYSAKIVEDGLAHQINNPEVPVKIDLSHSLLNEQKFRLENLANVLKAAYRGGDVEWWDEEEEGAEEGSGVYYGEYTDDEDFSEASGMGEVHVEEEMEEDYDEIIVPAWTQNREKEKIDEKWDPWLKETSNTEPSDSSIQQVSGGTSSVHLKNKFVLVKAVITYIMPVATCYLGSFLTDSPRIFQ